MGFPITNIVPDMAINTDINANIFVNKISYYVPLVIRIYYSLNGVIGLNVFNIN